MTTMLIRYKIKPDQIDSNLELLQAFFAELAVAQPRGVRYSAYQLDDAASFVHIVDTDRGPGPFAVLPAYQRYRTTVEDRCEEQPVMVEITRIGVYSSQG
jgi:hypothetical protein